MTSKKYKIAVDLDDTIVPLIKSFIEFCNNIKGIDIKYDHLTTPSFIDIFKCNRDFAQKLFDEYVNSEYWVILHKTKPSDDCIQSLRNLKANGHELIMVTAREHRFEKLTREYINEYMKDIFTDIILGNYYGIIGSKMTKLEMCVKFGCEILIDDNQQYLNELQGTNIKGFLFKEVPWNIKKEHSLTWKELNNILNNAV